MASWKEPQACWHSSWVRLYREQIHFLNLQLCSIVFLDRARLFDACFRRSWSRGGCRAHLSPIDGERRWDEDVILVIDEDADSLQESQRSCRITSSTSAFIWGSILSSWARRAIASTIDELDVPVRLSPTCWHCELQLETSQEQSSCSGTSLRLLSNHGGRHTEEPRCIRQMYIWQYSQDCDSCKRRVAHGFEGRASAIGDLQAASSVWCGMSSAFWCAVYKSREMRAYVVCCFCAASSYCIMKLRKKGNWRLAVRVWGIVMIWSFSAASAADDVVLEVSRKVRGCDVDVFFWRGVVKVWTISWKRCPGRGHIGPVRALSCWELWECELGDAAGWCDGVAGKGRWVRRWSLAARAWCAPSGRSLIERQ